MKDSTLALLKEYLKHEDGKSYKKKEIVAEFNKFKQTFYGTFPVDETTIAQHLLQKKGIKMDFPEYRVRGSPCKVRDLEKEARAFTGDLYSPVITVAVGAMMAEPKTYHGCPHDRCFAEVRDGNCSKERGGHGYVGEKNLPLYTTYFYKVSDGESDKDGTVATIRHDVNNGLPLEGVWKLKGMVTDGGFYAWAGIPVNPEELQTWEEDEEDNMTVVAPEDEADVDLSYLDDDDEVTIVDEDEEEDDEMPDDWPPEEEVEDDEENPQLPKEVVKNFLNIVKNEGKISKAKVKYWLETREDAEPRMLEVLIKQHHDKVKEERDDLIWL
ncbi:MAG: hypothetical protein ACTSPB_24035 [Candidatus Thorarchaeota archaeon]